MSAPWIGVDPGARQTGIVMRDGPALLRWCAVDRLDIEPTAARPGRATFTAVADVVRDWAGDGNIAIEHVQAPNPHLRRRDGSSLIDPADLIDTARMVGFLEAAFPNAVLVEPDGHGRRGLSAYPPELVTSRERAAAIRRGGLLMPAKHNPPQCHWRAAWDVAGAGPVYVLVGRGRQACRPGRGGVTDGPEGACQVVG